MINKNIFDKIRKDLSETSQTIILKDPKNSFTFIPCINDSMVRIIMNVKNEIYDECYEIDDFLDLEITVFYDIVYLIQKSTKKVLTTDFYYINIGPCSVISKEDLFNNLKIIE